MTDPVRLALERIASTSPRLIGPCLPTEHGCALCLALIDEARDALGWQRWPAVPGTLVPFPDELRDRLLTDYPSVSSTTTKDKHP